MSVELVSGNYFDVLGATTTAGRAFSDDDDKAPGAHPIIVLSYAYWQRRFNGSPEIVGQKVSLNGHPFTVIGIASRDFFGVRPGYGPDLWTPIMMVKQVSGSASLAIAPNTRDHYYLELLARIEPDANLQETGAAASAILQSWLDSQGMLLPNQRFTLELTPAPGGISRLRGEYSS